MSPQEPNTDVQLATMRGQLNTIEAKLDANRDAAKVQTGQAQRVAEEAKALALANEREHERGMTSQRDDFDRKLSVVRVDLESKITMQRDEIGARLDRMGSQIGQLLDFKSRFYGALALAVALEAGVTVLITQSLK
ncbi:MAG: hypothetical protein M3N21_08605 [Actinomycetota bacterium]|nr:hypothetical protein [Actinomycetota bacterium]